jgi:hypothetical protein
MNTDIFGKLFEGLGRLAVAIGRIVATRDEAAAERALAELDATGRRVSGLATARDAARSVPRPEPEDS